MYFPGTGKKPTMLELKIPDLESDPSDPSVLFSSFTERFLRNESDFLNLHLFPFWTRCPVCHMDLDMVGKTETTVEDTRNIIKALGLPPLPENEVDSSLNFKFESIKTKN